MEKITQKIFTMLGERRPSLSALLHTKGEMKLREYARSLYSEEKAPSPRIQAIVREKTGKLYGANASKSVESYLKRSNVVNTGDHHAIFGHLSVWQGNLLSALGARERDQPVSIVFAFGDVPLNNETFPRGILFDGKRYPLFPDREKLSLVYGCRSFKTEKIKTAPEAMQPLLLATNQERLSDQISVINHRIWERCCPTMPPVIYLQAEDIAVSLILDDMRRGGAISTIFMDEGIRNRVLEKFKGIAGAWDEGSGTHFFWGRSPEGKAVPLRVVDGVLIGKEISLSIEADSIIAALETRSILPGVFLTFCTFLMEGMRCLGGFSQVDYLLKYALGLVELGIMNSSERTDGFVLGPLYIFDDAGGISTDGFLRDPDGCIKKLDRVVSEQSVLKSTIVGIHRMYHAIVPEEMRDPEILYCSNIDLACSMGFV